MYYIITFIIILIIHICYQSQKMHKRIVMLHQKNIKGLDKEKAKKYLIEKIIRKEAHTYQIKEIIEKLRIGKKGRSDLEKEIIKDLEQKVI